MVPSRNGLISITFLTVCDDMTDPCKARIAHSVPQSIAAAFPAQTFALKNRSRAPALCALAQTHSWQTLMRMRDVEMSAPVWLVSQQQ